MEARRKVSAYEPVVKHLEDKVVSPCGSPLLSPLRSMSQRESSSSVGYDDIECTLKSDSPPGKVKSLKEVYESCTFALMIAEPTCYEGACRKAEREKSMQEELASIEKNNT